ncbi:hypothetical protein PRIPAC_91389 [Pristionchus pacificus]|uniref:Uncharacterized protein n=1 Tax=Pristionchus pacificus TaxID=54126 RepID=A0A2A6CX63_PRIPA|nr:hypothetical protein PRIPAC_91389 [Pristionchus pacificus]|eukprot:PDM82749.1 hypothetical protein PRIPAC_37142 [Pristionchus pacificus]
MPTPFKDKKWQADMNGNYFHDNGWAEYINASKSDRMLSDREVQFTIVEKLSIGCARKICSLCLVVPPPFPNCTDCEKAFVKIPRNDFECAALTCKYPATQIFIQYGKFVEADGKGLSHVNVDPVCRKGEKSKSTKSDNDKGNEGNETGPQPSQQYGKVTRSRKPSNNLESKAGVGDWLKNNWVSSILVPLIIIGIIGGCIIFLVAMVRTKDEQDQLHRQGLRMEEDIREGNCGSIARSVRTTSVSNSRSDEALV